MVCSLISFKGVIYITIADYLGDYKMIIRTITGDARSLEYGSNGVV